MAAIVGPMACAVAWRASMGDKSPKAKQRDQKQKSVAKAGTASAAKTKQEGYSQPRPVVPKGKK
jgi:hypothetical protein